MPSPILDTPPGIFYDLSRSLGFGVLKTGQAVPSFPVPSDPTCQEIRIPCNVALKAYQSPLLGTPVADALGRMFYFVGDENFRDTGAGGFVDFERVFCQIPKFHNEFESWAWNVPGLQNNTVSFVTGGGICAPVYSSGIRRPQLTLPVLTRLAHSYYVVDQTTGRAIASSPEPPPAIAGTYLGPAPVSGSFPFENALYQALLIGKSDGEGGVQVSPLIGNDTTPNFATWLEWGEAGVEVCVEATHATRWRGAIWRLVTRWAQVFDR